MLASIENTISQCGSSTASLCAEPDYSDTSPGPLSSSPEILLSHTSNADPILAATPITSAEACSARVDTMHGEASEDVMHAGGP